MRVGRFDNQLSAGSRSRAVLDVLGAKSRLPSQDRPYNRPRINAS